MDEMMFRKWMAANGYPAKVTSDTVSRLKKLERSAGGCDLDEEFTRNRCTDLLALFVNKGHNSQMSALTDNELPVGKYHLSTYKYALNLYLKYKVERQRG